jgi:hypothetical protein
MLLIGRKKADALLLDKRLDILNEQWDLSIHVPWWEKPKLVTGCTLFTDPRNPCYPIRDSEAESIL